MSHHLDCTGIDMTDFEAAWMKRFLRILSVSAADPYEHDDADDTATIELAKALCKHLGVDAVDLSAHFETGRIDPVVRGATPLRPVVCSFRLSHLTNSKHTEARLIGEVYRVFFDKWRKDWHPLASVLIEETGDDDGRVFASIVRANRFAVVEMDLDNLREFALADLDHATDVARAG